MKPEYNMAWGDPVCVRQALTETLGHKSPLAFINLDKMGYPPHLGNIGLIKRLKNLALRQTGHKPKHLIITCGGNGALNAALNALKTQKSQWVVTDKRHYPLYPAIANQADMLFIDWNKQVDLLREGCTESNFITLAASPSNPEGRVHPFEVVDIYDAAYASRTYSNGGHLPVKWKIVCGSLSKTLGLSGLRIGFAATNNDELARIVSRYVTTSYAGLSAVSMAIAEEVLENLDFDRFEIKASAYLDDNREEMQRVLTRFGQGTVPTRGMFAILELGKMEKRALEKANIRWQPGSSWGEDDSWARLSLGQSREIVKSAVKSILR